MASMSIPSNSAAYYEAYHSYKPRPGADRELVIGESTEVLVLEIAEKNPEDKILEQQIGRMEGVEFVVPEGFSSFEEYLTDWSEKFGTKLPDPWEDPAPSYSFSTTWSGGNMMGHYWLDDNSNLEENFGGFMDDAYAFFRLPGDSETYWEDWRSFQAQQYDASLEYQAQIAAGKGAGLENLTKTINIQGVEMTLNDLVKTQKIFGEAIGKIGQNEGNPFEFGAKIGISLATVKALAKENFKPDMAEKVVALYENRAQLYFYDLDRIRGGFQESPNTKPLYHYYSQANTELDDPNSFIADAYHKFADIDVSGDYEKSFDAAAQWYLDKMNVWLELGTGYTNAQVQNSLERMGQNLKHIKNAFYR